MILNEQKVFVVDDLKIYINGYSVVGGQSEHGFPHFDVKKNNKTIACYFIPKMSEFLNTKKIKHFKEGMLDTKIEKKICSILSKKIQIINDEGEKEDTIYLRQLQLYWNLNNLENPILVEFDDFGEF